MIDWRKYAVGGAAAREDSFSKLNPEYASRVAQMVLAADQELGQGALKITSAYRSPELQAKLFADAVKKYGSEKAARKWVAPPGRSKHNAGLAVDFADASGKMLRDANSREAKWIAQNAARFGLAVPMSWEPWQVELPRDGSAPSAPPVDTLSGGAGDVSLSGGEGQDTMAGNSIADIIAEAKRRRDAQKAQQPAPTSPADAYASTGALDVQPSGAADIASIIAEAKKRRAPQETQAEDQGGFARGLGLGVRDVAQGIAGTVGIAYDPIAAGINAAFGTEIPPLRENVSQRLTEAGLPVAETAGERVASSVIEGAAGALGGAGLAGGVARAAAGPVARAVASQMAAAPIAQAIGGGSAGAGQQLAAEGGVGPVGQAAAALGAGIVGGGLAATRMSPSSQVDDLAAVGAQRGVRVMTSDINPPETFAGRWLSSMGEKIPVAGTGGMRAAQSTERVRAVQDFARQYVDDASRLGDDVLASVSDDLMKTRGAALTKYKTAKDEVISRLSGNGVVPVDRAIAQVDNEVARLEGLGLAELRPVIDRLNDWKRAIQGKDLGQVELIRKQLGESFEAPDLASVRGIAKDALSRIYKPLREDMGDFIKSTGDRRDFTQWQVANKRLSSLAGELDASALKSALQKGSVTPESVKKLLFSQNTSDVRRLYRNLSNEGKSNARAAIVHEALAKSGGIENVSPQKFATALGKLNKQTGVFFSPQERKNAEGFIRLLQATSRADVAALNPPTGMQAVPILGGMAATDLMGGMGAGVASMATVGGLARLYESRAIRPILAQIQRVKPGSAEEAALVNRALSVYREMQQSEGDNAAK